MVHRQLPAIFKNLLDQGLNPSPVLAVILIIEQPGKSFGVVFMPFAIEVILRLRRSEVSDPSSSSLFKTRLEANPLTLEEGNTCSQTLVTAYMN